MAIIVAAYSYWHMLYGIWVSVNTFLMTKAEKARADLKSIGLRIRHLRGGVLQEELATYLGISQGQLSKIERGKLGPSADTLIRLVDRFGKSADWILTGKE
jgi:DNA-binding XRE family transcriptional regulator